MRKILLASYLKFRWSIREIASKIWTSVQKCQTASRMIILSRLPAHSWGLQLWKVSFQITKRSKKFDESQSLFSRPLTIHQWLHGFPQSIVKPQQSISDRKTYEVKSSYSRLSSIQRGTYNLNSHLSFWRFLAFDSDAT